MSDRDELPKYFRRKIFLKSSAQIKQLRNFDIYQYGISEQSIDEINQKFQELNKIWFELKRERIQSLKLNKIISSFAKD